jgi:hypothetical protein
MKLVLERVILMAVNRMGNITDRTIATATTATEQDTADSRTYPRTLQQMGAPFGWQLSAYSCVHCFLCFFLSIWLSFSLSASLCHSLSRSLPLSLPLHLVDLVPPSTPASRSACPPTGAPPSGRYRRGRARRCGRCASRRWRSGTTRSVERWGGSTERLRKDFKDDGGWEVV